MSSKSRKAHFRDYRFHQPLDKCDVCKKTIRVCMSKRYGKARLCRAHEVATQTPVRPAHKRWWHQERLDRGARHWQNDLAAGRRKKKCEKA